MSQEAKLSDRRVTLGVTEAPPKGGGMGEMGENGAPFRLHAVREAGRELSAHHVDVSCKGWG